MLEKTAAFGGLFPSFILVLADRSTTVSASTGRKTIRAFQQICKRLATKPKITPEGYALIFLTLS